MSTVTISNNQIYKFQADNHGIDEGFLPFRAEIWDKDKGMDSVRCIECGTGGSLALSDK